LVEMFWWNVSTRAIASHASLIHYGWCVSMELSIADTETIGYSDIPLPVIV
jgi:hypothetical protein